MSLATEAAVAQPRNLHASAELQSIRRLGRRLRILGRLLARRWAPGHQDDPGEAVLLDLRIQPARPRSAFDLVDIHHGMESSRMRLQDMSGQGWRGS